MASGKSPSTLESMASPLAVTMVTSALELFTTGTPFGLVALLAKGLTKLPGIVTGARKETAAARKEEAAFLDSSALTAFTGNVLKALTREYAEQEIAKPDRKALLALADALPGWWHGLCRDDDATAHALSDAQFAQTVAEALRHPEPRPALEEAAVLKILTDAARGVEPAPDSTVLPYLANYIATRFTDAVAGGLTSLHGGADGAFRRTILDLHAQSIALIQEQTDKFDYFLEAHITETEGLAEALQFIVAGHERLEQKLDDVVNRVRAAGERVEEWIGAVATDAAKARMTRYLTGLGHGFRGYNEIGIEDYTHTADKAPAIWDIFVPPACTTDRAMPPEEMDAAQNVNPPTLPAQELLPLLADEKVRRHVLLADPGMGKSTLVQRLTAGLAERQNTPGAEVLNDCLPIPIILRDIVPHLPPDAIKWKWSTLCDTMRQHYKRDENAPPLYGHWITLTELHDELLSSPRAFFLVDGLDEIGDTTKRTAIRDAIHEGFRAHKTARWLVTSRIVGYDVAEVDWLDKDLRAGTIADAQHAIEQVQKEWGAVNLAMKDDAAPQGGLVHIRASVARRLYLAPFDNERQDAFVTNWFRERGTPDSGLMKELRSPKHDGIRVLSRIPNLLSYMAILKRREMPLPDGRAELYSAIAKAYLHSIDLAYRLTDDHGRGCPFSFAERQHLLAVLAGVMQHRRGLRAAAPAGPNDDAAAPGEEGGNITIPEEDLRGLLRPEVARLLKDRDPDTELTEFLHFIASRSGLLLPRGAGEDGRPLYGFTHLSFLEFFAACYLREELDHEKAMRLEAVEDGFDEKAWLAKFPRGPLTILRKDLPEFAARPEWHEVLIFLAEFFYDKPRERDPLLKQLFPALHGSKPVMAPTGDKEKYFPAMPLPAAALAIKLARDQHLKLAEAERHRWFVRLWDAFLAFRPEAWSVFHPWQVNQYLLDHPAHEASTLAALREAARDHVSLKILVLDYCSGLTGASIFRELWPTLEQLSFESCPALAALDGLPDSLNHLYLNDNAALTAVGHLPDSLTELTLLDCVGLKAVEHLPASLESLDLYNCIGLTSLDHLPSGLTELNLLGCTGLSPAALAHIKERLPGCDISWP